METKAFSTLEIKSLDSEKREIEGIASTPTMDRVGDVVDPTGLTFQKESPLLLNHKSDQPVGTVTFGQATARGLPFKAKIAKVTEPGVVKDRTDEAWHSVKHGLVKGVSIGFIPRESKPLSSGGTKFTKADVHELSLTAVPANPEATITTIKAVKSEAPVPAWLTNSGLSKEVIAKFRQVQASDPKPSSVESTAVISNQSTIRKDSNDMNTNQTNANHFVRAAIAGAAAQKGGAAGYAATRWGADSETARYVKAAVNPITAGADASGALTVGTISRQQFIQAVFSRSILGQLQGLVRVPAITRVNIEATPTAAAFFGEGTSCPAAQGNFGVQLVDKRAIGIVEVMSQELLRATDETAEATVSSMLQRALSRGIDNAFIGSQARGVVSPSGLACVATQASGFAAGIAAFTGDLTAASVLVNPLTAVMLRSATETQITAKGGIYGGLQAIASYAVPADKLFIVDGTRVVAYIGDATIKAFEQGEVYGLGATPTVPVGLFQTAQVAIGAAQYVDWDFVDGAAVEVSLTA